MNSEWSTAVAILVLLATGDWVFQLDPLAGGEEQERRALEMQIFNLDPSFISGMSAPSRLVSTVQGLRGDVFARDSFNLLLGGDSTIYCPLLDEDDSLTARIAASVPKPVRRMLDLRVATSARAGQALLATIENLTVLVAKEETRPDLVLVQTGGGDLSRFVVNSPWPSDGGPAGAHASPDGAFVGENGRRLFEGWYRPGNGGEFLDRARRAYREHPKLDRLTPALQVRYERALKVFERRLDALNQLVKKEAARLVLATQPISYGGVEDERTERYAIWYPETGGGFVPTPALFAQLLGGFNDVLRRFARDNDILLIDLAAEFGECRACFYDQWHPTVVGAERIGARIAQALLDSRALSRSILVER